MKFTLQVLLVVAFASVAGWTIQDWLYQLQHPQQKVTQPIVSPVSQPPPLSNAAIAHAANTKAMLAKEQAITQLFIKEQQQSLQRQVEEFLTLTEPLLLSTNLERQVLSTAISKADELHSKLDPNNFNPILEIRFEARRGTLQSLIKQ
jgi:hypothetical protein